MSASEVQGPLGVQLNLPSTCPVAFSGPEDQLLASGRTRSLPIGESNQGPSYGRRTQSESSLTVPAPMSGPRSPPAADNAASEEPSSAPSPVPTEIVVPDLTQEEIVVDIQHSGIKVRDFAYETFVPFEERAHELFDPILAWHVYETILENPNPNRAPVSGRNLRRLLDLGWVSEEADSNRWKPKDRESLNVFDSRPHYPWAALKLTQPKKEDLTEVASSRFHWVNADQLGPQFVSRGISRLAAAFRSAHHVAARFQKRSHAIGATETTEDPQISPRLKKRRLSTGAESAPSSSQPAPSPSARFPVALVNGKPPQQFPAGHLSSSPPRSTALPMAEGVLTRSLQRHLSVTSLSATCSVDLSSDSRTTLTQSTNNE